MWTMMACVCVCVCPLCLPFADCGQLQSQGSCCICYEAAENGFRASKLQPVHEHKYKHNSTGKYWKPRYGTLTILVGRLCFYMFLLEPANLGSTFCCQAGGESMRHQGRQNGAVFWESHPTATRKRFRKSSATAWFVVHWPPTRWCPIVS